MEVGAERLCRVKHLLAAFPYLLRHHIRYNASVQQDTVKDIPDAYRLTVTEPSAEIIETRYEDDQRSGGTIHSSNAADKTRCSTVDIRQYPWSLLPKDSLKSCAIARNKPLWICDRISKEIVNISYSSKFSSR